MINKNFIKKRLEIIRKRVNELEHLLTLGDLKKYQLSILMCVDIIRAQAAAVREEMRGRNE